jgi:hypothetical protein
MANERTQVVPGELIDVTFSCVNPLSPYPICPAFPVTFNFTAYTPRFERYSGANPGKKRDWHSFEHYKSVTSEPAANGGASVISESSGFYPTDHATAYCPHIACGYDQWIGFNFSQPFGDAGSLDKNLPLLTQVDTGDGFIPPPSELEQLKSRALSSILPLIKSELSVPNFIYELKDFKRPLQQASSVLRSKSFYDALLKLGWTPKQLRRLTFSKMLQGSAGQYLNYQFNVKPLVTDIAKFWTAMSRTERRVNDFLTREGRPQNRHYVFSWAEFTAPEAETITGGTTGPLSPHSSGCSATRTVSYEPSRFHVQVQYNYNYTGYQREHALLLGHLDALGIQANPAIIWNAIPWTFVLDWVVGVSPYLDQLKVSNFEPVINIHRALWSIKRVRTISVVKRTLYPSGSVISQSMLPTVTQTAYRRSLFTPTISSILSSGLTSQEASLGAALVISRKRR